MVPKTTTATKRVLCRSARRRRLCFILSLSYSTPLTSSSAASVSSSTMRTGHYTPPAPPHPPSCPLALFCKCTRTRTRTTPIARVSREHHAIWPCCSFTPAQNDEAARGARGRSRGGGRPRLAHFRVLSLLLLLRLARRSGARDGGNEPACVAFVPLPCIFLQL
ncbi:hypothetical protein B0H13DRAFT_343479 [Mycena leptocephala]|nr:hypothetical protein B0H13DRAFT_343479 [Mycena leptocephala]